jgi:hypothetical protein
MMPNRIGCSGIKNGMKCWVDSLNESCFENTFKGALG